MIKLRWMPCGQDSKGGRRLLLVPALRLGTLYSHNGADRRKLDKLRTQDPSYLSRYILFLIFSVRFEGPPGTRFHPALRATPRPLWRLVTIMMMIIHSPLSQLGAYAI